MALLGGEEQPSAELMELSTVPMGVAAEAVRRALAARARR